MKKILFLIFFLSQSSFADSLKPLNQMTEFSDATGLYMYQRCAAMYLSVESILLTGNKDNDAKEMHAKAAELATFALMFAESKGMTNVTSESNTDAIQRIYDLYEEDILQSRAATGNMTDGVLKDDMKACGYLYGELHKRLNKN